MEIWKHYKLTTERNANNKLTVWGASKMLSEHHLQDPCGGETDSCKLSSDLYMRAVTHACLHTLSKYIQLRILNYVYMCVLCVVMSTWVQSLQNTKEGEEGVGFPPDLELWTVMSRQIWVLGTESEPPTRAVGSLNHWVLSQFELKQNKTNHNLPALTRVAECSRPHVSGFSSIWEVEQEGQAFKVSLSHTANSNAGLDYRIPYLK